MPPENDPPKGKPVTPSTKLKRRSFVPKREDMPLSLPVDMNVVRKIANEILPWLVSAEVLAKKPLYRAHTVYSWTRDVLAGLSGFGLSHPLAKLITGESTDMGSALGKMPFWLYFLTGFSVIAWVALKTYVTRDDGEKRAMLAMSCRKEFMSINLRLRGALQQQNPLVPLAALQAEVTAIVDRHIAEGSWHFPVDDILAPDIHEDVRRRTIDLVLQYHASWDRHSSDHQSSVDQVDDFGGNS